MQVKIWILESLINEKSTKKDFSTWMAHLIIKHFTYMKHVFSVLKIINNHYIPHHKYIIWNDWIGCWVIATGWKLKKGLEIDPSHKNQIKKELGMFLLTYMLKFHLDIKQDSRETKNMFSNVFMMVSQILKFSDLWKKQI